jgi:hypothetical protein
LWYKTEEKTVLLVVVKRRQQMPIEHKKISQADFAKFPVPSPKKTTSDWDLVLDELENGDVISIPVESDKQLRGFRIGMARRAASREMKLEFRATETALAVRKSDQPYVAKPKKEVVDGQPRRRGRPRKTESEE